MCDVPSVAVYCSESTEQSNFICHYNTFYEGFLVPYDRLLTKIAASGVELRIVIWKTEFLLGLTQTGLEGNHQKKSEQRKGQY
jgi:hypothetical protein